MTTETIPLTYKGGPLRRLENTIYYGSMMDRYIVLIQILETKCGQDLPMASRLSVQLQLTDPTLEGRASLMKRSEKDSLYAAMDIASVWLERALVPR